MRARIETPRAARCPDAWRHDASRPAPGAGRGAAYNRKPRPSGRGWAERLIKRVFFSVLWGAPPWRANL